MLVSHSKSRRPADSDGRIQSILGDVSPDYLRHVVERIAYPRHYIAEPRNNACARDWLAAELRRLGYAVRFQGDYDNVLAFPRDSKAGSYALLGAHYDTVPDSPGADDNGSAIAACLGCARALAAAGDASAMIAIFNREEDGLLGSADFVRRELLTESIRVDEAHIFEMVGFCSREKNSQRLPPNLPIRAPEVGDFLALLGNRHSNAITESILRLAATYVDEFPVLGLKIYLGIEKHFGHLLRSDHAPFWEIGVPAVMWTDTSEFRNPHYHQESDTPDTLDYEFMAKVVRLALARIASRRIVAAE